MLIAFSSFREVRRLVGELDFSFHAVSTGDVSVSTSIDESRPATPFTGASRPASVRDKSD